MPLRAVTDSGNVHAFELDEQAWGCLKQDYRQMGLRMPCCGVAAVPKTSPLGTRFFAHARKGDCVTAPESAEHIYCKNLIAQAAQAAGWTVTTERAGATPDGEAWIADVFCEKGNAKLAFEVQMSPQAHVETMRRQARYRASGVRGAWFYGPKGCKGALVTDKDTPAFSMSSVEVGSAPIVERFHVSLPEFVRGMLEKRLAWKLLERTETVYVEYMPDTCWSCHNPVRQVYGYLASLDDSAKWGWHERPFTIASISTDLMEVALEVRAAELSKHGLNIIGERTTVRGKPTNWGYSNFCQHCHAPQDNFHLGQKLREALYGLTPSPSDSDSENWTEPSLNPQVELAEIDRMVQFGGHWAFTRTAQSSAGQRPGESLVGAE